jgi:16S rRNA (cytidine1402-2'-O)-methyltransferase
MGKLYIVPTPIGNLEDMTFRAIRILKEADLILAEDTRNSFKLLRHFGIDTPMESYHMHNEHKKVAVLTDRISTGTVMALISDAGTPSISDPGVLLTRACLEQKIEVDCLPGATAFVPALVNSGLPSDRFVFEGFLPLKKGRQTRIKELSEETRTLIFYESPHKLIKTLEQLIACFGPGRPAAVSRELSKLYEETLRASLAELLGHFKDQAPKGEFVIVVGGRKQ